MHLNLIGLTVENWERMVEFYRDVIGFEPILLEPDHRYGWLNAGSVRVGISEKKGLSPVAGSRVMLQFQVENIVEEIHRLESHGCVFFDKQFETGEAYKMASFRDPEGNAISIYESLNSD